MYIFPKIHFQTTNFDGAVTSVAFCPESKWTILAVTLATGKLIVSNSFHGDRQLIASTTKYLAELREQVARQVVWHHKGDYFATFAGSESPKLIYIHQLSRCKSQWVSCMLVDTYGDNLFVGGHDKTFSWIDLQLSSKPWKCVRHHTAAVRAVAQHRRYPLIATVSDDATAIVYYARISNDPLKENEFVPVRRLRSHSPQKNGLAILAAIFHPTQAWLITAGSDGSIALFT
ncbi:unnamed protein product [Gongylonema pulchrum]|uniref:WD_REPEATS_REGION domain-containing protein n=1 Tax=Gongylonema pulchrum TaxID=637853 RepID=A0A3P7P296_9BILA|nr:unnamed protein product [Gongylonema pulchrum]